LQTNSKVLRWTLNTKLAIADELIARRLTLFEAAAGFHAVDGVKQRYIRPVPNTFPGQTDAERLCWQVITFVEESLRDSPDQEAVVACLEEELQEHLDQYGPPKLPEFRRREGIPWFEP
jgi:hypothetical protein